MMRPLRLKLKARAQISDIYIGRNILHSLGRILSGRFRTGKIALIADGRLKNSMVKRLVSSLLYAGWSVSLKTLKAGEKVKSLGFLEEIYDHLIRVRADRDTPLVAIGGGTIGDAAGFAASTYHRGIPLVHIPTTLLAQVDSAIGGKTAVNHPLSKNAIGTFYHPELTISDVACLQTLARREFDAGMAEVVKYALVFDPGFGRWLDKNWESIVKQKSAALLRMVRCCAAWKARVVAQDELENSGQRELLNFGHTVGHALESVTHYRRFLHGEAVAWGMRVCVELSKGRGWLGKNQDRSLVARLLDRLPAPRWPSDLSFHQLRAAMRMDKKARDSKNIFILLRELGNPVRVSDVRDADIEAALKGLNLKVRVH